MKRLIVTADDFGLDVAVNEAVERGHCDGILTSASLMVAAPAARDAVARARRLPDLAIGLHVAVVDAAPVLEPAMIPSLVDNDGRLPTNLLRAGVRFRFDVTARKQLEQEIRAQFEAYSATGLALDHVDCHNHMHLHPDVLEITLRVGREYGMRAMRLPFEPIGLARRAGWRALAGRLALAPWLGLMRRRVRHAGLVTNDYLFGLAATGGVDEARALELIAHLPAGLSELYVHPAAETTPDLATAMPGYRHTAELGALLSPRVRDAISRHAVTLCTYANFGAATA